MSLLTSRVMAGESISHSIDASHVPDLIEIIKKGKSSKVKDTAEELSKLLSKSINGTIEVRIVKGHLVACISPPDITFRHPLINKFREHNFTGKEGLSALSEASTAIGGFNPVTGKLSGLLTKVVGVINVSEDFINCTTTNADETAALLSHEVGHHIGYCIALSNMVRGNVAITFATSQLLGEESRNKRIELVKTSIGLVGGQIESKDLLAAADCDDENLTAGIISVTAAREFRSKYGSSIYDREMYEQISDLYAARLGLSTPLGTGLIKIHKAAGAYETMNSAAYVALEILKVSFILITLMGNPFNIFAYWFTSKAAFTARSEYPTLSQRIDKLINDANSSLSCNNLADDQKVKILKTIADLKDTKKQIKRDHGLISGIYTWVHTSRDDRNIAEQLRKIEALSNNSLYASATRLSTIK